MEGGIVWRGVREGKKKRTGRMLSRGEGEVGRRTGGGERGLNGGREARSSDLSNQADLSSAQ